MPAVSLRDDGQAWWAAQTGDGVGVDPLAGLGQHLQGAGRVVGQQEGGAAVVGVRAAAEPAVGLVGSRERRIADGPGNPEAVARVAQEGVLVGRVLVAQRPGHGNHHGVAQLEQPGPKILEGRAELGVGGGP